MATDDLDLTGLEQLARDNPLAGGLLIRLRAADTDEERRVVVDRWMDEIRPIVHVAAELGQRLRTLAAVENARANR